MGRWDGLWHGVTRTAGGAGNCVRPEPVHLEGHRRRGWPARGLPPRMPAPSQQRLPLITMALPAAYFSSSMMPICLAMACTGLRARRHASVGARPGSSPADHPSLNSTRKGRRCLPAPAARARRGAARGRAAPRSAAAAPCFGGAARCKQRFQALLTPTWAVMGWSPVTMYTLMLHGEKQEGEE